MKTTDYKQLHREHIYNVNCTYVWGLMYLIYYYVWGSDKQVSVGARGWYNLACLGEYPQARSGWRHEPGKNTSRPQISVRSVSMVSFKEFPLSWLLLIRQSIQTFYFMFMIFNLSIKARFTRVLVQWYILCYK